MTVESAREEDVRQDEEFLVVRDGYRLAELGEQKVATGKRGEMEEISYDEIRVTTDRGEGSTRGRAS